MYIVNTVKRVILYGNEFIMPPTLKSGEHIGFGLCVRSFVRSFVLRSVQKKIQASVLKFHIWIPRQKIAYRYFFSCLNYLPLPSYDPFKG